MARIEQQYADQRPSTPLDGDGDRLAGQFLHREQRSTALGVLLQHISQCLPEIRPRKRADDTSAGYRQKGVGDVRAQSKFRHGTAQADDLAFRDHLVEPALLPAQPFKQQHGLFIFHEISILAHLQGMVEGGDEQSEHGQQCRNECACRQFQRTARHQRAPSLTSALLAALLSNSSRQSG